MNKPKDQGETQRRAFSISLGGQEQISLQDAVASLNGQLERYGDDLRISLAPSLNAQVPTRALKEAASFDRLTDALEYLLTKCETKTAYLEVGRNDDAPNEICIQPSRAIVEGRPERLNAAINAFKFLSVLSTTFVGFMGAFIGFGAIVGDVVSRWISVIALLFFGVSLVASVLYVMYYIQKLEFAFERAEYHRWAKKGRLRGVVAMVAFLFGAISLAILIIWHVAFPVPGMSAPVAEPSTLPDLANVARPYFGKG
ncbi:MAG: hypothetical protein QNJ94_16320 [Alphaproteobacteria bacterium]|nr:hypothetical protein [Alphaproteobacteria bacterium]